MSRLAAFALGAMLAVPPSAAGAANALCTGSVTGAVQASFDCTLKVVKKTGDVVTFQLELAAPIQGLDLVQPVSFSLKLPITSRTYTSRDLVDARAKATTRTGKLLSVNREGGGRGYLEVQVDSVERDRATMIGTLHVRIQMVPADPKDGTEIRMNFQALANW
jgi:hypothetical protein